MALCPHCNRLFREPEDEQGDHPCPYCGCEQRIHFEEEENDE